MSRKELGRELHQTMCLLELGLFHQRGQAEWPTSSRPTALWVSLECMVYPDDVAENSVNPLGHLLEPGAPRVSP